MVTQLWQQQLQLQHQLKQTVRFVRCVQAMLALMNAKLANKPYINDYKNTL
jgi:hypothetical protein